MANAINCHVDLHTIAAIKGDESYENLAIGFSDVFSDINFYIKNPAITFNEINYSLDFFYVLITRYAYAYVDNYSDFSNKCVVFAYNDGHEKGNLQICMPMVYY